MQVNNVPAYTISNENQRWATQVVPNVQSVLTVAGSGDQALFYKLAGAEKVVTFDMTSNARIIQDIKCAAIKHLNLQEYKDLLIKLHSVKGNIMSLPEMQFLGQFLPSETLKIIENSKDVIMFGLGLDASFYPENIPTEKEYAKLRATLNKPFRFIWKDLKSLSTTMTAKYDLINISNIFDYVDSGAEQIKILKKLSKRLNKNGHIICLPQKHKYRYDEVKLPHLSYERVVQDQDHTMAIIFQRTR
jgi:hypothetical protein